MPRISRTIHLTRKDRGKVKNPLHIKPLGTDLVSEMISKGIPVDPNLIPNPQLRKKNRDLIEELKKNKKRR